MTLTNLPAGRPPAATPDRQTPVGPPPAGSSEGRARGKSYRWLTYHIDGQQPVSPRFDTPEQAGKWRRDNPVHCITLWAFEGGERRDLTARELTDALWVWMPMREAS